MKTLQNNFTTPEQSKRLLEIGVPVDSADCFYYSSNPGEEMFPSIIPLENDGKICFSLFCDNKAIPCWSVGRLREIFCICSSVNGTREYPFCNSQVAWWITEFEFKKESIDFSKLEE